MNKLFIALPILALLSIGAVFLITHHQKTQTEEFALEEDTDVVTIYSWQQCFQSLPLKVCDQIKDYADRSACYIASSNNSQLVWDDSPNELPACVGFYAYFKNSQAGAPLNRDNYYEDCFLSYKAVLASKKSDFFFDEIYQPKYIKCAGF